MDKIRKQVAPFLDFDCGENSAIAANNYDWFGNMNVLTFLRDIGKHFSVNQMINKEALSSVSTVKIRGFRSLSFPTTCCRVMTSPV